MKKLLPVFLSLLLLCGCGLVPKKVELFQSKVKKFPESTRLVETQKEAAFQAKATAAQTFEAAILEGASTNVVAHARDTALLTDAVSTSLGPPRTVPTAPPELLSAKLLGAVAKLDSRIESFKQSNDENAGKKIEGTGLLQIPYFVYLGGFLVVVFVLWHLGKLALTAASLANPGAAVGLGVMNVAGSVAGKGLVQLVAGGKKFVKWANESIEDPAIREKVVEAFNTAHKQAQDSDVRPVVDRLLK